RSRAVPTWPRSGPRSKHGWDEPRRRIAAGGEGCRPAAKRLCLLTTAGSAGRREEAGGGLTEARTSQMAGLIPQHFIDDLVGRSDIVEVVGARVQLRKAGREYKACCPFHDEKTPSFTVSPTKGFYHCFGCGAHGTALGFLMEYEHLSFPEAVEALARIAGVEVPREDGQRPARRHDELFELLRQAERHFQAQLKDHEPAIEWLKTRGIDGPTAKRFGIGYAPDGWSL